MTSNYTDIVKLALDYRKGSVEKYSQSQANETLRKALLDMNGGSTKIDYRAIRDGKCQGMFSIIEAIVAVTTWDELQENDFFNALVDARNVALGDEIVFDVEDSTLFFVDQIADGTQALRRQRIADTTQIPVPTIVHGIRIYEELSRILAGRVDFNKLIDKVSTSVREKILNEVYTLFMGATAADLGGTAYFPAAGSYNEDTLLDVIQHVEAAAGGRPATIIGTKKALKPLKDSLLGPDGKNIADMQGYVGKFYGTDTICVPQRHKVGTSSFVFPDNILTVIANGDNNKPIKLVYEGDPLIIQRPASLNMDLTEEFFLQERWGTALSTAGGNAGVGRYQFTP